MPLSEKQLAAAHRLGQDVCVVAGPGSGKTSVLIERFSWLVREQGIPANRILAITFTERASTEIKQRLVKAFANAPELREQVERAYVSTVHAFCARLLRENAIEAGVDPEFEVLDWSPARSLLHQAADLTLEDLYERKPDRMRRFLRSLAVATERDFSYVPDLATSLIDIYNAMRIAGVPIDAGLLRKPNYEGDLVYFRQLLTDVTREDVRTNTAGQRETHDNYKAWAQDFLSLPREVTRKHFHVLNYTFKANFVKSSRAQAAYKTIREEGDKLRAAFLLEYYGDERELVLESLKGIDTAYRKSKRDRSGLDFDDLEEETIHLLQGNSDLREKIQSSFDFVLMDELQDTNPLQWKLLSLIRRRDNFFAVGDVNQSIFAFRHAEPALFHGYRESLAGAGKAVDELRDNYRSRAEVLDAVNTTFGEHPPRGVEAHSLIPSATFPVKAGPSVEVIAALGEINEEAQRIEALWVARRIVDLSATSRFGDMAILTRANAATATLQNALDEFGIPSIVLGGLTFFDTREVRDLVLLLSVLANPYNEIALAGLLRSPMFGLSDEDLLRLRRTATLAEAVEKNPPPYWDTIRDLRANRNLVSPERSLRRVIDESDYESGLSSRARANVEKFLSSLRTRYESNPAPLSMILSEIENAPPDAEAPPSDFGDAVRLMTIHKSKGLEFPIVFLPYLHTRRPNMAPIITYSHDHGLGITWRDPAGPKGQPDLIHDLNKTRAERIESEEESRLLYVAMTRAKEHMVVSYSVTKRSGGAWAKLVQEKLAHANLLTVDAPPQIEAVEVPHAEKSHSTIPRNVPSTQYDSSITATDISTFAHCPRSYYLSRYLRIDTNMVLPSRDREGADPSIEASELGNQVHAILANKLIESPTHEAVELADVFRTSDLGRQATKAERKEHELDFIMAIEDVIVRGQIDLWFEHNRKRILVDYKTDKSPGKLDAYETQLRLYALALESLYGFRPDEAYLHFLRPNKLVEIDLSPLALNATRQTILDFRAAQEKLHFPVKAGEHCYKCAHFRRSCPVNNI